MEDIGIPIEYEPAKVTSTLERKSNSTDNEESRLDRYGGGSG